MNEASADSPAPALATPKPNGESWRAEPKRSEGWSRQRWLTVILLVVIAQVGFIFIFGEKKFAAPRTVTRAPQLQLADNANELIALNDPTLFASPNARDFAAAVWLGAPVVKQPSFRWTETPRWLPLAANNLGATFAAFMQTNSFGQFQFDFKPPVEMSAPVLPVEPTPQNSTLQITGELAQRRLLNGNEIHLPTPVANDVLAPSRVQVLVDAAGNVASAVLLPSENILEAVGRADAGETNALPIARSLRFAPAARVTFGELIFNWHTVPLTTTNEHR